MKPTLTVRNLLSRLVSAWSELFPDYEKLGTAVHLADISEFSAKLSIATEPGWTWKTRGLSETERRLYVLGDRLDEIREFYNVKGLQPAAFSTNVQRLMATRHWGPPTGSRNKRLRKLIRDIRAHAEALQRGVVNATATPKICDPRQSV